MGKCENCKYFEKPDHRLFFDDSELKKMQENGLSREAIQKERDECYEVGQCHRFPATVKPKDYGYEHLEIFRDDWCGEFEAKEEKPSPGSHCWGTQRWLYLRCRHS